MALPLWLLRGEKCLRLAEAPKTLIKTQKQDFNWTWFFCWFFVCLFVSFSFLNQDKRQQCAHDQNICRQQTDGEPTLVVFIERLRNVAFFLTCKNCGRKFDNYSPPALSLVFCVCVCVCITFGGYAGTTINKTNTHTKEINISSKNTTTEKPPHQPLQTRTKQSSKLINEQK